MGDNIAWCDTGFGSGSASLNLYDTVRKPFVADDDLERRADKIGVIEFDTGAIGAIIPQDFDACRHQIGVETGCSLSRPF